MEQTAIVIHAELENAIESASLAADGARSLRETYAPHFKCFDEREKATIFNPAIQRSEP